MTPPQIYNQIVQVYNAMAEQSVNDVYKGYLTYLFVEELGLSVGVYTPIMRRLQDMGCVEQITSGARNVPSEWKLIKEPSLGLYREHPDRRPNKYETLRQEHEDLKQRVEALEERNAS